jgi:hypothetical protein
MEKYYNYSSEAERIATEAMEQIHMGKIRNHKLRNKAAIHSGEIESKECNEFCNFLPSKNCDFVMSLRGSDNNG